MKLTQTHGTIGGTGYYRGNDGIVYYGNPQNGYLTESLQSQYQRQSSTPTSAYSTSSSSSYNSLPLEDIGRGGGGGGGGVNLSGSLLEGVLFVALSIFSLTVFLAVIAVFMVFYAVLSSWPYYVRTIIKNFIRGTIDRPLILITAALIFLAGYFVFCAYKVLLHRKMRSKGYLIAGTLEVGLVLALVRTTTGGFAWSAIIGSLFTGLSLAALPAITLCFLEHLITKKQRGDKRWFITLVSKQVSAIFSRAPIGVIPFGVVALALGTLFMFALGDAARVNDIQFYNTFRAMGVFFVAMGVIDKVR